MKEQDLIDSGYKKFRNSGFNLSDYGYQKKFTDDKGVMYFINIWVYNYNKPEYKGHEIYNHVGFVPDIQFQIKDDDTVNISYILSNNSELVNVEKKVHDIWVYHGKPYYELYNE